ncbi:hypothetical protein ALC57_01080, partial [Trachymyrmex cornetzi]
VSKTTRGLRMRSVSRSRRREASRSIVPERIIGQGLSIFIQFTFSVLYPLLRKVYRSLSVSEGLSRGESSITPEPFSISTRYYYNIACAFPKLPTNCLP